ncbi:MAG: hypothetical protein KBC32_07825 [Candidatus Didemnitutus sp.]|nr:hypothetical protein [Candidatus Didemnitutus sp.]
MKASRLPLGILPLPAWAERVFGTAILLLVLSGPLEGVAVQPPRAEETPWSASSGEVRGGKDGIAIRAGVSLSHQFRGPGIRLRTVSRPFFSDASDAQPSVEFGQASVSFVRGSHGAGLVLLGQDGAELRLEVPLGGDGRSADPLEILFVGGSQGEGLVVRVHEQAGYVGTAPVPDAGMDVVISAGAAMDWTFTTLEISEVTDPDEAIREVLNPVVANLREPEHPNTSASGRGRGGPTVVDSLAMSAELRRSLLNLEAARQPEAILESLTEALGGGAVGKLNLSILLRMLALDLARERQAAAARRAADEALRAAEEARQLAEERPALVAEAWRATAEVQRRFRGDLNGAKRSLEEAARRAPADRNVRTDLANANRRLKKFQKEGRP